jgi:CHASE2 domain-containing sensor protein
VFPLGRRETGERIGAVASVVIFIAVYAACVSAFGVLAALALGWLPAAIAAVAGAHAVRFLCRFLRRTQSVVSRMP